MMVPLPCCTSNTVPSPDAPPSSVVPKRLPLLSSTRPPSGLAPLVPLKEARVVMVPLPCCTSNTVPSSGRAAIRRGAEEIAAAVLDQAAVGVGPVGAVEGGEGGDGAAALLHLEHRAVTRRPATIGGAEEIAAAVLDQAGAGVWPRWCR